MIRPSGPLQITVGGPVAIGEGDEVTALRNLSRPMVALYVGGMGAKGKNFYNDVVRRYGFEEEAEKIQDLYLDGKKAEAEALVPDELLEATSLCGPESYVAERIAGVPRGRRDPPAGASRCPSAASARWTSSPRSRTSSADQDRAYPAPVARAGPSRAARL